MNQLDGILILCFLPLALLLCGYWLAARMPDNSAGERLALALLGGLVLTLAAVAAVNYFRPLAGLPAYACLLPGLPSLWPRHLSGLWRDVRTLYRARAGWILLIVAAHLSLLLWPMLRTPSLLFYDGTSNHDSFFWVAGAEHLKRHTYLEMPTRTPTQPMAATAAAIVGWKPDWGRMGAEGLLAMASSVIGASPLKLYLYATACLYFAWLAGAWLALKTFVTERPGLPAGLVLVGLQPLFSFYYGNANLPNLLGALTGAAFVITFERALRSLVAGSRDSDAYLVFAALSFHGLLCVYPEMVPFVLLPAGLLWLRHWLRAGWRSGWRHCLLAAGSVILGLALNCATTVRAFHGFLASFGMARADQNWANLFNPLDPSGYIPALVSLSVPAARSLSPWLGWPLSLLLLGATALLVRRARDWFGLLAIFSGSAALIIYTVVTDFAYGWQKSAQFAGVFFAMAFPAALVQALVATGPGAGRLMRRIGLLAAVALLAFMTFATAMNFRETYKWSDRKIISADWFALRDQSRAALREAPVLIEAASFRMAFFHGMWAAYFLTDSHIYFGTRGDESGGYLRNEVINEGTHEIPPPAAILMGRAWADALDAGSPRLLTGREYVLLSRANRVFSFAGVFPFSGLPDGASPHITLQIKPINTSTLRFELSPRAPEDRLERTWKIHRRAEAGNEYSGEITGVPPWHIEVPMVALQKQSVTIELAASDGLAEEYPFKLSDLRITRDPASLSPSDGKIDFTTGYAWEDYHVSGLDGAPGLKGTLAGPGEAVLRFIPAPAEADLELELVAEPHYRAGVNPTPLPTELWFNDSLVFTGFFSEPGVLRARIFREHWNQAPVAQIRLRFPNTGNDGPRLLLKSLTTRRATSPRP